MVSPANGGLPAQIDVSTGEFLVTQRKENAALHKELTQLDPAELLWGDPNGSPTWCPERLKLPKMASASYSANHKS
ncbi:hypothetical protein PMIT1313_00554 [Prochlorococcus marinus str. MIT 1313]|nr:hypothetical protein PMIT1313_00554 [Prochlorococcus marinus str. MIT 1313]KZR70716.1 hypothetical protein PMIT1318_01856 [Prochlorococcus marinus str. MIT 1318]